MSSKIEVLRELLERAVMPPGKESLAVSNANIIERGQAQAEIRELLAATAATASLTNEGDTPVVERHPVGYEYYSRPLRSWRPLETEADKARAESMDCDVREIAQPELAALQSTIAHLRQHKNDYMEASEETRKALTAEIAQLKAENADIQSRLAEACEFIDTPYDKEPLQALIAECRYGVSGKGAAIEVANDLLNDCCDNLESLLKDNERLRGDGGISASSNIAETFEAVLSLFAHEDLKGIQILIDARACLDEVRRMNP